MKIKNLSVIGVLLVAALLPVSQPVSADSNHDITNRVAITASASADELQITHTVTIRNRRAVSLDKLEFALPVSEVLDIEVKYNGGRQIPFSSSPKQSTVSNRQFSHQSLVIDFPRQVSGQGESWQFSISYTTQEGISAVGENVTLVLPLMDGGVAKDWTAAVRVPTAFPDINYRPPADNVSTRNNLHQFDFSSQKVKHNVLGLSFLSHQTHTLDMQASLRNRSPLPRTLSINLPFDSHNQAVFIDNIDPKPTRMSVDEDGNVLASYWLWPMQRATVNVAATVTSHQLRYDFKDAETADQTPAELSSYLGDGKYWPVQDVMNNLPQDIKADGNAWEVTSGIYDFIISEITFSEHTGRLAADKVLETKEANTQGITDLMLTLLRGHNIPARQIEGFIYPSVGLFEETASHTWVEAYIAGVGWVTLDPLWSEIFKSRGYSSSDRVGLRAISRDSQLANTASLEDIDFNLEPAGELPEKDSDQINISAKSYMLIPGISYDVRAIRNDDGYVVDEVLVPGLFNGSIAPHADLQLGRWRLGFDSYELTLQVADEEEAAVWASVVRWPMLVVGLILVAVGVIQFYRYKRRKYLKERLHGQVLH